MKRPSITIYFDNRNMPDDSYQVKWSVYYDGKQRQFASGVILSKKDVLFLKMNKTGLSGRIKDENLRNLWNQVYGQYYLDPVSYEEKEGILYRGQKAAAKIEDYFTFEMFASVVSGNYTPEVRNQQYPADLIQALRQRSLRLKESDDIANSNLFESTAASLTRFAVWKKIASKNSAKIPFQVVTPALLREYEKWMLKFGKAPKSKDGVETPASITTVGIYCRNIRTVFNEVLAAEVISEKSYPFGKAGFRIPKSNNNKKALAIDTIGKIVNFPCKEGSTQQMARDLWLFSYLCNGLNFTDICHLRRSEFNQTNNYIEFYREKTKDTKREDMKKIKIVLFPEAIAIIKKWGRVSDIASDFLFPFIDESMDAAKRKATINQVIKNTNYHMNKIAEALKMDVSINTYEARHTFATTLLRSEAPLAFISEKLGHSSIKTTQSYLGSFEDEQTVKYLSALIPKQEG